jgi:protein SCO1/2
MSCSGRFYNKNWINSMKNHWKTLALGSVMAIALLALNACKPPAAAPSFNSSDITGINYAQGFSLPDSTGKLRSLADFKGKVVVVFFGYTHCPDVCPITMAELKEAKRLLGKDGADVQGIFITLDPARDTPEVLAQYVPAFDPSFIALVGNEAQTAQAAKDFRVYYKASAPNGQAPYTVDHTAASFVFDRQGHIRLYTRYNQGADKLAADLRQLLATP